MFISEAYSRKLWTNHERRAAQARAFQEAEDCILPARFDDTEIPGVMPTVGYVSLAGKSPEELASLIERKLVSAGGSVPTELVRRDFGSSHALPQSDPTLCVVLVEDDRASPVAGATVTAQADNGTVVEGRSDAQGRCELPIRTRRAYRLLISHPEYPGAMIERVDPVEGVRVTLARTRDVGSAVIHGAGPIPGLEGRLNPILDTHDRTYLYADNVAIDGGKGQPCAFSINVPMELEDANGTIVFVTVKHIAGRVALLQFTRRS